MNFTVLDWSIVAAVMAVIVVMALISNRYTKSVSDYLAAGRAGGRYMMTMASGMVWIGAINVVAMFELYDSAGFPPMWWVMFTTPFAIYLAITGFGVYRFRQTRAMTVAQFLETRYNRSVRVYSGILAWVTGLLYFGIFPAVGARFFIAFCDLPTTIECFGYACPIFPLVMFILLSVSLFFVFVGGHIAVLVTDCLQGIFTQIAAVVIVIVMAYLWFDWDKVVMVLQTQALATGPEASLLDPMHAEKAGGGFNFYFFVIGMVVLWYSVMSNMQGQAYVASSKTAHEFRIGMVLNQWRWLALLVFFMVLVMCAKVVMQHPAPEYQEIAASIQSDLEEVSSNPDDALRKQVTITTALSHIMPKGIAGIFAALMLAALISTYDSFMHTWGVVFLQDVIMPFRKKPFSNRQHLWMLRLSIFAVAAIAFTISWLFFDFQDNLMMYFASINNIWLGGAGAVILGGLYWRRGTTRAAIATLIIGTTLGLIGFIGKQYWPSLHQAWPGWFRGDSFPIDAQWFMLWTVLICLASYVCISLMGNARFNIDKMLHRGKYAIETDQTHVDEETTLWQRIFGIDREFNWTDRLIAYSIVGWFLIWLLVFVVGTVYGIVKDPGELFWAKFWHIYLWILFVLAVVVTVWLSWGGIRDTFRLFKQLHTQERDYSDDGMVKSKNDDED